MITPIWISDLNLALMSFFSLQQPYKSSMEWIQEVPVIEVDGNVAICDGDDAPGLGHPREFIQLNKSRTGEPETCKYCGLRYAQKKHHH